MGMSRRQFVASATSCGIALSLSRAAFAASPDFETRETLPGRRSWNPAATPGGGRIGGPPRSQAPSFMPPIFAQPTFRVGRRVHLMRCSSVRRMRRMSSPASTFHG